MLIQKLLHDLDDKLVRQVEFKLGEFELGQLIELKKGQIQGNLIMLIEKYCMIKMIN